jgi:adenylate kinase family enzyme
MKIQIIGFSGSGKSTLAKRLSEKYNLNVLYLDTINFSKDWKKRESASIQIDFDNFYNNNDNWIIEGNNYGRFLKRFDDCDKLIFLNINRFTCLKNILKRHKYYKKQRDTRYDAPNYDKLTLSFLTWVLFGGRSRKYKNVIKELKNNFHDKFIELKNQKEIDAYLKSLEN